MHRLCACALFLACISHASESGGAILELVKQAVAAQLTRTANYACVETLQREYLISEQRSQDGCAQQTPASARKLWMQDRLRLDVAVSQSSEIYSWHGAARFTSSDVSEVVQTGAISSGSFVGFLQNIFVDIGAQFTYAGESNENGRKAYNFNYVMPLARSGYHVRTKSSRPMVPFHGSFSIDPSDYHLVSLQVIADAIPRDSLICSAETNITYQIVNISGRPSLIPAKFVLQVDDNQHVHTISSNDYSQCREFRGESTLHFETADTSKASAAEKSRVDRWLPAGIPLHVGLRTPVDSRTSYVGDSVEGALLHAVKLPGTETTIPKGALLKGVITELEDHYRPHRFQLCSVKFNRLTFGSTSFLLNASPKTSNWDAHLLHELFGQFAGAIGEDYRRGVFVLLSSHLHLDRHFSAEWITGSPSANPRE